MSGDIFAEAIPLFWSSLGDIYPLFFLMVGALWFQREMTV